MSKGLGALESIKQTIRLKNDGYINLFETLDFLSIEKELKALEIIKKKKVNLELLPQCNNVRIYNKCVHYFDRQLDQEDFDLLKEVIL